jgi:AcrR family transcriptional regulator
MSRAPARTRARVQRDEAREQIHRAALEALRTERFRDLSLDKLMARTDLARTAFYRFYDDLPTLVLHVLGDVGSELYRIVERWVEDGEVDFPAAAERGLTDIVDFFQRNGPLVRAVVDAASADELVEQAYEDFLATYERLIAKGFDLLVERGDLPECDTTALATALNRMGERYMLSSFGTEPYADAETVKATMTLIWERTITSR